MQIGQLIQDNRGKRAVHQRARLFELADKVAAGTIQESEVEELDRLSSDLNIPASTMDHLRRRLQNVPVNKISPSTLSPKGVDSVQGLSLTFKYNCSRP